MQQIQQKIDLNHNLHLVCLILCLVCLALSIFFFFKFDIRNIFNIRTGRSVKKTVKQMEELNARTGQLRRPELQGTSGSISRRLSGRVRKVAMNDLIENPASMSGQIGPATPVSLASQEESGASETELLQPEYGGYDIRRAQEDVDTGHGPFRLEYGVMLVHTEERI